MRLTEWEALKTQKAVGLAARQKRMGIYVSGETKPYIGPNDDTPPEHHNYIFSVYTDINSNIMTPLSGGDFVNGDDGEFGMMT